MLELEDEIFIEWFNKGQNVKSEKFYDQSIGKGHGINIKTRIKEILLEIKTSYDTMNLLTFIYNEIMKMKECKKREIAYYSSR